MPTHYLQKLFAPKAIAIYGASEREGSVAGHVLKNLFDAGFGGPIYPINPKHDTIHGRQCYASLRDVDAPVDLVVIATPARTVPELLREAGEHGVHAAIVLSAGFGEVEGGDKLQAALVDTARRYGMRVLGPNCLGLIVPSIGLNATFSNASAKPGHLALVSQSGALCTAILDWAQDSTLGFSTVASLGDAADIDFGDVLDYLATDPDTRSIVLYIEGIREARRFMSGLRAAARLKPVIVVKSGRRAEGRTAAMSHTGALVGGDDVFDAALRRAGAVRALTIEQLFAAAQLLSAGHRVHGGRLAVVTNAGGPGVMAADRAGELGLKLSGLSEITLQQLDAALPHTWSHSNPIDILGDAGPDRYEKAVHSCLADPGVDGVLVMLTPQAMTKPSECADAVMRATNGGHKPVITCWMGGHHVAQARETFSRNGYVSLTSPETSLDAFNYLWSHYRNQQLLMQVPEPLSYTASHDIEGARLIIENALSEGRQTLNTLESKAILRAFGIPTTTPIEAHSPHEALIAAEALGFPVVMKVSSNSITHKSDVGGVRLGVRSGEDVRRVYTQLVQEAQKKAPDAQIAGITVERMHRASHGRELLIGAARDPAFGPVISFGAGGTLVDVMRDRALALPPLNSFIVRDLLERLRIAPLLRDFRGLPPVNLAAVEEALLRTSDMVCELPEIQELDINPLIADENGVMAVDARIIVGRVRPGSARYSHMAIHPYPSHLTSHLQLSNGTDVKIRPIRPEDAGMESQFVRELSPESKYFRFMQTLTELNQEMLVRFTQIDYDREMAFIALVEEGGKDRQVGVGRYFTNPDRKSCEFALVVADQWQGKGIGTRLMSLMIEYARSRGLSAMDGEVLTANGPMLSLVRHLGFDVRPCPDDSAVQLVSRPL